MFALSINSSYNMLGSSSYLFLSSRHAWQRIFLVWGDEALAYEMGFFTPEEMWSLVIPHPGPWIP